MTRSLLVSILILSIGMLTGCSDPMYPQPKLPPIVIPPYVPPPPVDRSLLTIMLPSSRSSKDEDRPHVGRVRAKSQVNCQWIISSESRQRNGKQDDAHFAGISYYVTVFVPLSNGQERIASLTGQPEREIEGDGRWSYRLALSAPDKPGKYLIRLATSEMTLSESELEVIAGDEKGR